jgi:hypothetical protein
MLDFNVVNEHLYEPFAIAPGVRLPIGEYTFTRLRSNLFTTATRRRVSANATVTWGDYWSGTAEQVQAGVAFRLPPWFTWSLNTNQTWAHLPQGGTDDAHFRAEDNKLAVKLQYAFRF